MGVGVQGHAAPRPTCIEVLRDVAIATNFGTQFAISGFVRYNFGCMTASDMLFDSRGGFTGSWYPI